MALLKNVIRVTFVKVGSPIKPLAHLDSTPPTKGPFCALNAHPGRMPILSVPYLAKIVTTMHTNQNPMLRDAFQCKKVSTNLVQPPKLFVQRVNPVPVTTQCAKTAEKERSKTLQVKPPATTAPADGEIPATARPVATPYHQVRTH